MKKIFLLIILILSFFLIGCTKNSNIKYDTIKEPNINISEEKHNN
jgi:thioredoxin-related protein